VAFGLAAKPVEQANAALEASGEAGLFEFDEHRLALLSHSGGETGHAAS
jgi:hypothetical protein